MEGKGLRAARVEARKGATNGLERLAFIEKASDGLASQAHAPRVNGGRKGTLVAPLRPPNLRKIQFRQRPYLGIRNPNVNFGLILTLDENVVLFT